MRVESTRSFEEVLLRLRNLVGTTTIPQESTKASREVPTREQFEQAIESQVGESDFTLLQKRLLEKKRFSLSEATCGIFLASHGFKPLDLSL